MTAASTAKKTGESAATIRNEFAVSSTSDPKSLKDLERNIAAQSAVDAKRVAAVQEAIRSGSYQIDAAAVAKKLIEIYNGPGEPEEP
ncbi:MAG: flagellar biosynthesis anti-sigma factor FlgM [Pseudomonadota bacterium]|nr:MAG: flagellar biosynthesis anti-sigma factor FlgM [Pseudomonadota bacterium]